MQGVSWSWFSYHFELLKHLHSDILLYFLPVSISMSCKRRKRSSKRKMLVHLLPFRISFSFFRNKRPRVTSFYQQFFFRWQPAAWIWRSSKWGKVPYHVCLTLMFIEKLLAFYVSVPSLDEWKVVILWPYFLPSSFWWFSIKVVLYFVWYFCAFCEWVPYIQMQINETSICSSIKSWEVSLILSSIGLCWNAETICLIYLLHFWSMKQSAQSVPCVHTLP